MNKDVRLAGFEEEGEVFENGVGNTDVEEDVEAGEGEVVEEGEELYSQRGGE